MSFTFFLGVLASCISGFVTVNRFGFALEGARCAFDRIYYDSLNGQLKTFQPRWEGFNTTRITLTNIQYFCGNFTNIKIDINTFAESIISEEVQKTKKFKNSILNLINFHETGIDLNLIPKDENDDDFKYIKGQILMNYFHSKSDILYAFLKVISMIYFCLFLITVTAAEVSMMFYACLKRQGYLITFMHILWNIIRFFILSFFLYGTAYGVFFLIMEDLITTMDLIFKNNLTKGKFLYNCLFGDDSDKKIFLNEIIRTSIYDFFLNLDGDNKGYYAQVCGEPNKEICNSLEYMVTNNTLGSFDCSFLKSDLQHLYKILEDASVESRILSALSLCSSFFGAIAVYFYLLVIHHYNNELFFDSGKSIFTGFDGFGKGYKKKNHEKDPAYKKRKLRAEIELTSKNEEQNGSFDKNEDD